MRFAPVDTIIPAGIAAILALLPWPCQSIEFPNTILGLPDVKCGENTIELSVNTESGFPSHMFVTGRHDEPECVTRNTNKITVNHESCGLIRERNLSPPGIMYRMCVAVQLHPQFVTKVDRTFCARCFYTEGVNELTRDLEVSPQGSTEVPVSFDAPTCTYTIRRGSPTGAEVRYATVGEPVFHVWSCPGDLNGMLVQNCYVEDGQGNRILIIDQNGCGVDQYVIRTPEYDNGLTMAYQESHVFKFADKTITRFTCQIKICIKAGNGCDGITPPQSCPESPGPGVPLGNGNGSPNGAGNGAGNGGAGAGNNGNGGGNGNLAGSVDGDNGGQFPPGVDSYNPGQSGNGNGNGNGNGASSGSGTNGNSGANGGNSGYEAYEVQDINGNNGDNGNPYVAPPLGVPKPALSYNSGADALRLRARRSFGLAMFGDTLPYVHNLRERSPRTITHYVNRTQQQQYAHRSGSNAGTGSMYGATASVTSLPVIGEHGLELDVSDEIIVLDDPTDELGHFLNGGSWGTGNGGHRHWDDGTWHSDDREICVPKRGAALMLVLSCGLGLFGVLLVVYLLKIGRNTQKQ